MSSFREQISSTIRDSESRLQFLRMQQQPDPHVIEGEQKELEILKRKLGALPTENDDAMLSH